MTLPGELKEGKTYIIIYIREKDSKFVGTFCQYVRNNSCAEFQNVSVHYSSYIQNRLVINHYNDYRYYDIEKINNAQTARQRMEKRALDIVLKRLVDENFTW